MRALAIAILLVGASAVMASPTPPPELTVGEAINTFKQSSEGAQVAEFLSPTGQPAEKPAENPTEGGQPEQWPGNNPEQPAEQPAENPTEGGQPEQMPENNMDGSAMPEPGMEEWTTPEGNMVSEEQNTEAEGTEGGETATTEGDMPGMEDPATTEGDMPGMEMENPATTEGGMPGMEDPMENPATTEGGMPGMEDPIENPATTEGGMPGMEDPMENPATTEGGMPGMTANSSTEMTGTEETWSANNSTGASKSTETGASTEATGSGKSTTKVEGEIQKVSVGADGCSPKKMTVKKGSTLSFWVQGEGAHTVTQSAKAGSCTPMNGGFGSKNLTKGDTWNYTVPADASGSIFFYSGTEKECEAKKMWATATVVENLVADNTTGTGPSNSSKLSQVSGAGSMAPVATSMTAVVLAAAHWLF